MPGAYPGAGFGRGRGFWNRGFGGGRRGRWYWFQSTGFTGQKSPDGHIPQYGNPPNQNPDPKTEAQALKDHARILETELDFIKKRLEEIDTSAVDAEE
jgi:hypothetical protein